MSAKRIMTKPCPFCSSHGKTLEVNELTTVFPPKLYQVHCYKCHASGPEANTRKGAKLAWNDRQDDGTYRARGA